MRLHTIILTASLFLCQIEGYSQHSFKKVKVNKQISLSLSEQLIPMSSTEINAKYVSYRLPIAMFTSRDQRADFGINSNSSYWTENDMEILRSFYQANIQNLFSEVHFYKNEVTSINGYDFAVFEFTSKVTDEDNSFGGVGSGVNKYNLIAYTLLNNQVILFNFSCDNSSRAYWQEAANEMIFSIQLKK